VENDSRYRFIKANICDAELLNESVDEPIDEIVHFAAESHVDRSIDDAQVFLRTNLLGTQNLLDFARKRGVGRFVHVSTDEVYGSLGPKDAPFTEDHAIVPNSPYAASKAGSDLLVRAAFKTHGLPVLITRCSNNYGPFQFPEKLIPLMIANALEDRELPVYGDGSNVRDWIHVRDHAKAVDTVRRSGKPGRTYNIGGGNERTNLQVVSTILEVLGKPTSLIKYVKDRPGHDRRYAIDDRRIKDELGFTPSVDFERGIRDTVNWYLKNRSWWERVRSGDYQTYYQRMYGNR
jgi:dTDP-glucose 4,6-dehydratase